MKIISWLLRDRIPNLEPPGLDVQVVIDDRVCNPFGLEKWLILTEPSDPQQYPNFIKHGLSILFSAISLRFLRLVSYEIYLSVRN